MPPIDSAISANDESNVSHFWDKHSASVFADSVDDDSESADSLARFFEEVAPRANRFAMSMTRRWCDSEELVQEAFLRLAKRVNQTEESDRSASPDLNIRSHTAYLFATIRNLAIDRQRKSGKQIHETCDLENLPGRTRDPARQQQRLNQLEAAIATTIDAMPSNWADALRLKINGDLTYVEIAEILNATTDQVRGWIFRARKKLAAELRQKDLLDN